MKILSPDFAIELGSAIQSKKPQIIKDVFDENFFSTSDILQVLRSLKLSKNSDGPSRNRTFVYVNGTIVAAKSLLSHLSVETASELSEVESEFKEKFEDNSEMGVMVNDVQSLQMNIWENICHFLSLIYSEVGCPQGGAITDLFWGNYKSSFLGLHKDNQDVFGFVIKGKKTILLWPFDYFKEQFSEEVKSSPNNSNPLKIDFHKYTKDAIRLEAEAGDLILWPSEYWHLAVSEDTEFSCMMSVGVIPKEIHNSLNHSHLLQQYLSKNPNPRFATYLNGWNNAEVLFDGINSNLRSTSDEQDFQVLCIESDLLWLSKFGFDLAPPISKELLLDESPSKFDSDLRLRPNRFGHSIARFNEIFFASSGIGFRVKHTKLGEDLFNKLQEREVVTTAFVQSGSDSGVFPVTCFYDGEPGKHNVMVRNFKTEYAAFVWILAVLKKLNIVE